jgi:hypothetical protein
MSFITFRLAKRLGIDSLRAMALLLMCHAEAVQAKGFSLRARKRKVTPIAQGNA